MMVFTLVCEIMSVPAHLIMSVVRTNQKINDGHGRIILEDGFVTNRVGNYRKDR